MANLSAYRCDVCGSIMVEEERTRRRTRYEGPVLNGDLIEDVCSDCLPDDIGGKLTPIPRRHRAPSLATIIGPEPTS